MSSKAPSTRELCLFAAMFAVQVLITLGQNSQDNLVPRLPPRPAQPGTKPVVDMGKLEREDEDPADHDHPHDEPKSEPEKKQPGAEPEKAGKSEPNPTNEAAGEPEPRGESEPRSENEPFAEPEVFGSVVWT